MTPAAPPTSARLLRAADAERAELDRHRERLQRDQLRLRDELARIEAAVADVDERQRLLDRLAPRRESSAPVTEAGNENALRPDGVLLRGPAIRETAVRLLLDDPRGPEALHYRDWFTRLAEAGFSVAGKDPLAVFLTQLTRSPVLRKSTQAGVYELDRGTPARLRAKLARLHDEFQQLTARPAASADLGALRARRDELNHEIGQTERTLEEAERALGGQTSPTSLAAVS